LITVMEATAFLKFMSFFVCHEVWLQGSERYCWPEKRRELIRQACEAFEIGFMKGFVSLNHLHVLVSEPADLTMSEILRRTKGRGSMKLLEIFLI
jgi:hypothetical protein